MKTFVKQISALAILAGFVFISCNGPQKTYTANGVSFKMIKVEGGTFEMSQPDWSGRKNVHSVTLSSFRIGESEVTQELWQAVMGYNPSSYSDPKNPVTNVNYDDCQLFIEKLNQITGEKFRLPTEAEWEYAANEGQKSNGYQYTYSGSNDLGLVAWTQENSEGHPHNVMTKQPNALGIYDMTGNVDEICHDWFAYEYSSEPQTNPQGPDSQQVMENGSRLGHVRRGSSYETNGKYYSRSIRDFRNLDYYPFHLPHIGFRLAMDE